MFGWTQTVTAKVLGIGALALAMLIPLAQVRDLVTERQQLREGAVAQIAQGWGARQVVGGLLLAVPTQRVVAGADKQPPQVFSGTTTVLADTLTVDAAMAVQTRRYGIYGIPVFTTALRLRGRFLPQDLAQARQGDTATWQTGKAQLRLLLADLHGLRGVSALRINGRPARFESSAIQTGHLASVVVPLDLDAFGGQPIEFDLTLDVAGTESLQLLPLARITDVAIRAPWPDPSFIGASLPLIHRVDASGFTARWRVLDLNRRYGQHWSDADTGIDDSIAASSFGVQLYQPVDVYQRNLRASKYGLLFIGMTFLVFFLIEVMRRLRVHPLQYLLIGAALATFYVVLLALSEQIAFGLAYALAAGAVVLIVSGYAAAVLRERRAGVLMGVALAVVYAVLYGLIAAESYALLIGSVLLLAALALLMYLTRRIDWYAYAPGRPHGNGRGTAW